MPSFETNAPKGYMGDPRRGAAMGRGYIGPDRRTVAELDEAFAQACKWLSDALRLKENRPGDGYKARCWEAAAQAAREEKEELRALIKAAQARPALAPMITLQRVRLDAGGYDPQGAYWGLGEPLYWAASDDVELDWTFRARSRDEAKAAVRATYPGARFHN